MSLLDALQQQINRLEMLLRVAHQIIDDQQERLALLEQEDEWREEKAFLDAQDRLFNEGVRQVHGET